MFRLRLLAAIAVSSLVVACSSGGSPGGNAGGGAPPAPTPTPTPTPPSSGCTLRERQDWAAAQLGEWYLCPETLPAAPNPAPYSSVSDYVDALTATARSQNRDRYFTHVASIAEENAYYDTGATAGFGIRLKVDSAQGRVVVTDVYEGSPAGATQLARGSLIEAVGTSATNLRLVSDILRNEGEEGLYAALGPSEPGVTRVLRYTWAPRLGLIQETASITKASYAIPPVSPKFGVSILYPDSDDPIGYLNLRTFISTAEPELKRAFAQFRAKGVRRVVVDLRYNGGGLVRVAELLADLLGGNRAGGDVLSYTSFRPSKAAYDETRRFQPQPESIAPMRVAFIVTGASASASELVINAMTPWLRENSAIIGSNTYGKPVGQIAVDRAACDDRLRIVAFATQNADRQGDYYNGLAGKTGASCAAIDDLNTDMGEQGEASMQAALWFLNGQSCPAMQGLSRAMSADAPRTPLPRETTAQREIPGVF